MQTNPAQSMPPQLCICLLKEVILTFLRDHLPLSREQRDSISTQSPQQQDPKPKEEQPSNPVEGAGAGVKDSVLKASESASAEALTTDRPQLGTLFWMIDIALRSYTDYCMGVSAVSIAFRGPL